MIGYYVHHHGSGHRHRFEAVRAVQSELIGLGSGPQPADLPSAQWLQLALDATAPVPDDPTAGGTLHWAPLGEPGLRRRTRQLADWADRHAARALVVDVSVEVALTARLLSLPAVVVAQHGDRHDDPHRSAYRSATAVAALWPAGAAPDPPGEVVHVGPISRFDAWTAPAEAPSASDRRTVLVLCGRGGAEFDAADIVGAAEATRGEWRWEVLGLDEDQARQSSGDRELLWRADAAPGEIWRALHRAHVVVTPASNNCVAEVAAARRPLIALPQARPFDEQHAHARVLAERELAHVAEEWPEPARWPALLDRAADARPAWGEYHDRRGAQRLSDLATAVAAGRA